MAGKIISAKIEFDKDDCYCGIPDFYDQIAKVLGYNPDDVHIKEVNDD